MSNQLQKIFEQMVTRGYRYDPVSGTVYGVSGRPLKATLSGSQRYPTYAISVPTIGKGTFACPCHRVVGYFIWGDQIFHPDVQVRHKNGLFDLRQCSLQLGTRVENMSDVDPAVRSRAAQAGRAAQNAKHGKAKLPDSTVRFIKNTARRNSDGFLLPGELERLSKAVNVRVEIVSGILRGLTYKDVK